MLKDLITKNRSYRRFEQNVHISKETLLELVELARLSSSAANLQPLKYVLSYSQDQNEKIFPYLRWAGYLPDWNGPIEGEKPSAYIIMVHDQSISKNPFWDHGIASQSIMLGAVEKGYGGCMFGAFDKEGLTKELQLPEHLDILMVLALGKPIEEVVLEPIDETGSIKYYRDENKVHHVPKRSLEEMIISASINTP